MTDTTKRFDVLTVIGLAATAYVVTTLLHEGLGHGGACIAVGGKPVAWGAYYFDCNTQGLPDWAFRAVAAAGNTVNLVVAFIAALILNARLKDPDTLRGPGTVFLWLMYGLNAFTWAGYFLFSGVAGIGDWGTGKEGVLYGLDNQLVLRIVMAVFGGIAYFLTGRAAGGMLGRLIGGDNRQTGRKLAWTAYVSGGALAILIGLMNPVGIIIVLISSMASSLGGTSGLLWLHAFMRPSLEANFSQTRSWLWIALGVAVTAAYAIVFGTTVKL